MNVRGQLLYPVLGNNPEMQIMGGNLADMPPLLPGPHRPGPLPVKNSKDRERAIELIKQVNTISMFCFAAFISV